MRKKGFTLVELLPAILIMGIIMLMIGNLLTYGKNVNTRQNVESDAQRNARRAIMSISDDIRKGTYFIDAFDDDSMKRSFQDIDLSCASDNLDVLRPSGYTPLVYAEQVNGGRVLYAFNAAAKELHKLTFTAGAIKYDYGTSADVGRIDEYMMSYFSDNYKRDIDSSDINQFISGRPNIGTYSNQNVIYNGVNYSLPFFYYQGNDVFECVKLSEDPDDVFKSIRMIKEPIELNNLTDEVIANDISEASITKLANSYKISVEITETNSKNNYTYEKKLISNIAIGNYGGDKDNE